MKIIKEIKTEVVDLRELGRGIDYARVFSGEDVRIVMSHDTLNALRYEATRSLTVRPNPTHRGKEGAHYFEGCPIDINDELPRGEVKFTHEVRV